MQRNLRLASFALARMFFAGNAAATVAVTANGEVTTELAELNITPAVSGLDTFIADIVAASIASQISNEWNADGSLIIHAGELLSLAQTLRFSLTLLNGATVCN